VPAWCPADLVSGLYFTGLAAALGVALRRFWEPPPARLWVAAALSIGALCGSSLFAGAVLLPLDSLRAEVPFRGLAPATPHANPLQGDLLLLVTPALARVGGDLGGGRWPLWNPSAGAGMPLLADPQSQALQPLALLAQPLGPLAGAGFLAALRLLLALVFSCLLLRRQGLGPGAALCGAVGYGLGGFLLLWLGWPLANAGAWLPVLLYALQRTADRGLRRDVALASVALAGLLLAGQPDGVLYGLLVAAAFAVALRRAQRPGQRRGFAARAATALVLGALAAAPALLPAALYLPQSLRAARLEERARLAEAGVRRTPSDLRSASRRGVEAWLPLAAPNALGNGRYGDPSGVVYWGRHNTNEDASGFAGTLLLLAAALGLAATRAARRPHERWLAGALLLCLVALAEPPGVSWLVERFAPFGHLQRLNLVVNFALAYLGACELDRRFRGGGGRRALLAVAAVLAVVLLWAYLTQAPADHPEALWPLRRGWLAFQGKILLLAVALLAGVPRARWAPAAAALLIGAELVAAHAPAWPPASKRLALPETPPTEFLRREAGDWRIAGLGGALPPNLGGLLGLADARVYNPVAPAAYIALTAPLREPGGAEAERFVAPGHPLYARLGVRFLLAAPGTLAPPPLELVLRDEAGWVFEEPRALPLLHLARAGGLETVRREPARLSAGLELAEPGLLATGVYQDGGWRVLVDRAPVETRTVEGPLLGAPLPAAGRLLELLYRPAGFLVGILLAALGGAGALASWTPLPRRPAGPAHPPARLLA
jgi:hypothetical protein